MQLFSIRFTVDTIFTKSNIGAMCSLHHHHRGVLVRYVAPLISQWSREVKAKVSAWELVQNKNQRAFNCLSTSVHAHTECRYWLMLWWIATAHTAALAAPVLARLSLSEAKWWLPFWLIELYLLCYFQLFQLPPPLAQLATCGHDQFISRCSLGCSII